MVNGPLLGECDMSGIGEIQSEIRQCVSCGGYINGRCSIGGPTESGIMIVFSNGSPRSVAALSEYLPDIDDYYITSVRKCLGGTGRCEWLGREIVAIKPKYILTLGTLASGWFGNKIGQWSDGVYSTYSPLSIGYKSVITEHIHIFLDRVWG